MAKLTILFVAMVTLHTTLVYAIENDFGDPIPLGDISWNLRNDGDYMSVLAKEIEQLESKAKGNQMLELALARLKAIKMQSVVPNATIHRMDQIRKASETLQETLGRLYDNNMFRQPTFKVVFCVYAEQLELIAGNLAKATRREVGAIAKRVQIACDHLRDVAASSKIFCRTETDAINDEIEIKLQNSTAAFGADIMKILNLIPSEGIFYNNVEIRFMEYVTASRNLQTTLVDFYDMPRHDEIIDNLEFKTELLCNNLVSAIRVFSNSSAESSKLMEELARDFYGDLADDILDRFEPYAEQDQFSSDLIETIRAELNLKVGETRRENTKEILMDVIQRTAVLLRHHASRTNLNENSKLRGVVYDLLSIYKLLHVKLQSLYQSSDYSDDGLALILQIQVITNHIVLNLRNVFFKDRSVVRDYIKNWQKGVGEIIQRLENECLDVSSSIRQVLERMKNILKSSINLETLRGLTELFSEGLQGITNELSKINRGRKLELLGNFNGVTRSVLVEYLRLLYKIQYGLSDVMVGIQTLQTPTELAFQIRRHYHQIYAVIDIVSPDTELIWSVLKWPTRKFQLVIEDIAAKLNGTFGIFSENIDFHSMSRMEMISFLIRQLFKNHYNSQVQSSIESLDQNKLNYVTLIFETVEEIQTISRENRNESLKRTVLNDFLTGLRNFHIELQNNLQVWTDGLAKTPVQFQHLIGSMLENIRWMELNPDNHRFKGILMIAFEELSDIKSNRLQIGDVAKFNNDTEVEEICRLITKTLEDVARRLLKEDLNVHNSSGKKIPADEVEHVLVSLQNVLVQLTNSRASGSGQESVAELAGTIKNVTNSLLSSFESIQDGKIMEQILTVQAIKFGESVEKIEELKCIRAESTDGIKNRLENHVRNVTMEIVKLDQNEESTLRNIFSEYLDVIQHLYVHVVGGVPESVPGLIDHLRYVAKDIYLKSQHLEMIAMHDRQKLSLRYDNADIRKMVDIVSKIISTFENNSDLKKHVDVFSPIQSGLEDIVNRNNTNNTRVDETDFMVLVFDMLSAVYRLQIIDGDLQNHPMSGGNPTVETIFTEALRNYTVVLQEVQTIFLQVPTKKQKRKNYSVLFE